MREEFFYERSAHPLGTGCCEPKPAKWQVSAMRLQSLREKINCQSVGGDLVPAPSSGAPSGPPGTPPDWTPFPAASRAAPYRLGCLFELLRGAAPRARKASRRIAEGTRARSLLALAIPALGKDQGCWRNPIF